MLRYIPITHLAWKCSLELAEIFLEFLENLKRHGLRVGISVTMRRVGCGAVSLENERGKSLFMIFLFIYVHALSTMCLQVSMLTLVDNVLKTVGNRMTSKQKYREFLESDFWIELSAEKRDGVTKCEECGKGNGVLQSHHMFYRKNWYDTKLEDLVVLCRGCHRKRHGFAPLKGVGIFKYREDEVFNVFVHRLRKLRQRIAKGKGLTERDRKFLAQCLEEYPKTPKDGAMAFQVKLVFKYQTMLEEGDFS